jgi:hypothetical protein
MSRCVEYNQKPDELTRLLANRQRTLLNLMHVTSSDAFASSLFGVAAPFGFGVYSGDLWIKYAHTEELNPICRAPACGHVCEERAADPVQGCAESNWPRGPGEGARHESNRTRTIPSWRPAAPAQAVADTVKPS